MRQKNITLAIELKESQAQFHDLRKKYEQLDRTYCSEVQVCNTLMDNENYDIRDTHEGFEEQPVLQQINNINDTVVNLFAKF